MVKVYRMKEGEVNELILHFGSTSLPDTAAARTELELAKQSSANVIRGKVITTARPIIDTPNKNH